jgi:hypothetical protein
VTTRRWSTLFVAVLALPLLMLSTSGCVDQTLGERDRERVTPGQLGEYDPARFPRLVSLSPNAGLESQSTEFVVDAVNLMPDSPAVVYFGNLEFEGITNSNGSRILNPQAANGRFTAPPGTGSIDIEVYVPGQNPPYMSIANGFTYLDDGSPALPRVTTMTPNEGDENGGVNVTFTGENVPVSSNFQIVVSYLFSTTSVEAVALQTGDNTWEAPSPPVPSNVGFTQGTMQVPVRVIFSDRSSPPQIPVAIISPVPDDMNQGNPFRYTHSGIIIQDPPEEVVIASGLMVARSSTSQAAFQANTRSFARTVTAYDRTGDEVRVVDNLVNRFMFNGSTLVAPAGTHYRPSPVLDSGIVFREANSSFAHFELPEFERTFEPLTRSNETPLPPVTRVVTGRLYYHTNNEAPFGSDDGFFAAYSNGEAERFFTGGGIAHKQISLHQNFKEYPFFAVTHRAFTSRLFVARTDGKEFVASGENTVEIDLSNITGRVRHLSVTFAGEYVYFTSDGFPNDMYVAPVDSNQAGTLPVAQPISWPQGILRMYVSDELALSGDGRTICVIAGNGNTRRASPQQALGTYSVHNVFAIQDADQGNNTAIAVTTFPSPKQMVYWDLGSNLTYGSDNVDNHSAHRRIVMPGVNAFSTGSGGTNLPGIDLSVNYDGTLVAFVTRENRATVDSINPPAIVYYLYVGIIGQGVNNVKRINSWTNDSFGTAGRFDPNMVGITGVWFPRKIPQPGMNNRLVFSVSGVTGPTGFGNDQQIFTADIDWAGSDINEIRVYNRTDPDEQMPFAMDVNSRVANYVGGFPSPSGHALFVINADTADLLFLDLRDGITTQLRHVRRAHDDEPIRLPAYDDTSAHHSTYLTSGFDPDPAGATNIEYWANMLQTINGPGASGIRNEWLMFVAEENPGREDLYILQMSTLTSPLPTRAVNVSNIDEDGVIRSIATSRDGSVLAFVKGENGYSEGFRNSGAVHGKLYVIRDLVVQLDRNRTSLDRSGIHIPLGGNKFSRNMIWYQNDERYTLYFGEGSSSMAGTTSPFAASYLNFRRLNLNRNTGNEIGTPTRIRVDNRDMAEGAVYFYNVGRPR